MRVRFVRITAAQTGRLPIAAQHGKFLLIRPPKRGNRKSVDKPPHDLALNPIQHTDGYAAIRIKEFRHYIARLLYSLNGVP
jgi:hypothetical protein